MSIPNVDDYERIEDFEDVRDGDIIVAISGNWYNVKHGYDSTHRAFCVAEDSCSIPEGFYLNSNRFDYALRKKPQLPDKPGLWKDRDGDIWLYSANKGEMVAVRQYGTWMTGCECFTLDNARVKSYAPFTPCKLEESC